MRDFGFGRRFDLLEKEIEIQIKQFIDMVKNGPIYEHEEVRSISIITNISKKRKNSKHFSPLQKYVKQGRILSPMAFGPVVGNCFIACLLNTPIARENMADIYK